MTTYVDGHKLKSLDKVRNFEKRHGIRLPEEYVVLAKEQDGASLNDAYFETFDPEIKRKTVIACHELIPFEEIDGRGLTMDSMNDGSVEGLPEGIVLFALEGSGLAYGFDYRSSRETIDPPVICFSNHYGDKNSLWQVADSFSEFLTSFFPGDEAERRFPGQGTSP